MKLTNKQIAEEFSRHNFEITFPFIEVNIKWNMVGGDLIMGKEKVIETCQQSLSYLKTVTTTFNKFLVLDNDEYITIDSVSEYVEQGKTISTVASCDIYKFDQGQLTEITSYCIELVKQK